jgi:hypothetical protein
MLASCCGLTFEHIDEMKVGSTQEYSLRELYDNQLDDFIKIWLRVDGPEKIFDFAARKDPRILYPPADTHPCQTCTGLFLNERVRNVLAESYQEVVPEVLFRYHLLRNLRRRAEPSFAADDTGTDRQVGFGA